MSEDDLKLTLAGLPKLTDAEAREHVATKSTAPKVTDHGNKGKIKSSEYFYSGLLTICVITMQNGFKVVGTAGCASPDNYNADVGNRYAYEDAYKKIWPLEGYLLREQLHRLGY